MLLFGDFGCRRRKFQLYLAVKGGKFGLQLFQFFLLLPHLACYLLQLRYLTFQDLILRFILVDDGGDSLNRVEEVAGGGQRVSQRQMPVVVGVLYERLSCERLSVPRFALPFVAVAQLNLRFPVYIA